MLKLIGGPCDGREIDIPEDPPFMWVNIPVWTADGGSVLSSQYDAHTGAWHKDDAPNPQMRDHPYLGQERTDFPDSDYDWPAYEAGYAQGYADAEADR